MAKSNPHDMHGGVEDNAVTGAIDLSNNGSRALREIDDETRHQWRDITGILNAGTSELKTGELLHSSDFILLESISAIEIMDPRLDSNMNARENPMLRFDPNQPITLRQCLWIVDRLFQCELTWHRPESLIHTIYTCLYLHQPQWVVEMLEIYPRSQDRRTAGDPLLVRDRVLMPYLVATCHCVMAVQSEMCKSQVYEEEDYCAYNFNMDSVLKPITMYRDVEGLLDDAIAWLEEAKTTLDYADDTQIVDALLHRTQLRKVWLLSIDLINPVNLLELEGSLDGAISMFESVSEIASQIKLRLSGDRALYAPFEQAFDPKVGRLMAMHTPLQDIALYTMEESLDTVVQTVTDFRLVHVVFYAHSFEELLRCFEFVANRRPAVCSLARSIILSVFWSENRILLQIPMYSFIYLWITRTQGPAFVRSVNTKSWEMKQISMTQREAVLKSVNSVLQHSIQIFRYWFKMQCQNPSRQRRLAMNQLPELDHLVKLAKDADVELGRVFSEVDADEQDQEGSLTSWLKDIMFKYSEKHILGGVPLDLYQPYELSGVYFQATNLYRQFAGLWEGVRKRLDAQLANTAKEIADFNLDQYPLSHSIHYDPEIMASYPASRALALAERTGRLYAIKRDMAELMTMTSLALERLGFIEAPWVRLIHGIEDCENATLLESSTSQMVRYMLRWRGLSQASELEFASFGSFSDYYCWFDALEVVPTLRDIESRWTGVKRRLMSLADELAGGTQFIDTNITEKTPSFVQDEVRALLDVAGCQQGLFEPILRQGSSSIGTLEQIGQFGSLKRNPAREHRREGHIDYAELSDVRHKFCEIRLDAPTDCSELTAGSKAGSAKLEKVREYVSRRWTFVLAEPAHPNWVHFKLVPSEGQDL